MTYKRRRRSVGLSCRTRTGNAILAHPHGIPIGQDVVLDGIKKKKKKVRERKKGGERRGSISETRNARKRSFSPSARFLLAKKCKTHVETF